MAKPILSKHSQTSPCLNSTPFTSFICKGIKVDRPWYVTWEPRVAPRKGVMLPLEMFVSMESQKGCNVLLLLQQFRGMKQKLNGIYYIWYYQIKYAWLYIYVYVCLLYVYTWQISFANFYLIRLLHLPEIFDPKDPSGLFTISNSWNFKGSVVRYWWIFLDDNKMTGNAFNVAGFILSFFFEPKVSASKKASKKTGYPLVN